MTNANQAAAPKFGCVLNLCADCFLALHRVQTDELRDHIVVGLTPSYKTRQALEIIRKQYLLDQSCELFMQRF
jgi:hypothetical protein